MRGRRRPSTETLDSTRRRTGAETAQRAGDAALGVRHAEHGVILVVDDDRGSAKACESALGGLGYEVKTARDVYEAVDALGSGRFDLVLADVALPEIGGLMKRIREQGERTPVVLMQEEPSMWAAVHALRLGAADYLQKPLRALDAELALIRNRPRALRGRAAPRQGPHRRLLREVEELRREASVSVREAETLRMVWSAVTYTEDQQRIVEVGLDSVFDLMEPDVAALTRLTADGAAAQVCLLSRRPLEEARLRELEGKISSSLTRWLPSSEGDGAVSISVADVRLREGGEPTEGALRSFGSVPLTARGKLLGSLFAADCREDAFTRRDLRALSGVAECVSLGLELAVTQEALVEANVETIAALGVALEARDRHAYGHAERDARFAVALAEHMGLSEAETRNVKVATLLHDIGKIGVSDDILNKPGPLTGEESREFQAHPVLGAGIISKIAHLGQMVPLVRHHHEWFDGSGYPDGLASEEIPLGARIMAVADAFGAMTGDRAHRRALPLEAALAELREGAGTQFDPRLVEAFFDLMQSQEGRRLLASSGVDAEDAGQVGPAPR